MQKQADQMRFTLSADRAMIVTGTPGIGKSMWLILLLILLAKAGVCVVLDSAERGQDKLLLSK